MPRNPAAARWIKKLKLKPHPEGGWYRETYRAEEKVRRISKEKNWTASGRKTHDVEQGAGGKNPGREKTPAVFSRNSASDAFAGGEMRSASTAIYFLLEGNQTSRLHRITSDELWHLYDGGPLVVVMLDKRGKRKEIRLGKNPAKGEMPQAVVPAGTWFGAYLPQKKSFALAGCTVAPGFEFNDLEFAERKMSEKLKRRDQNTQAPPVRGRTSR